MSNVSPRRFIKAPASSPLAAISNILHEVFDKPRTAVPVGVRRLLVKLQPRPRRPE